MNVHGRPGKNIPSDLHMEHLNRTCKTPDTAIVRVGKAIGPLSQTMAAFDESNKVPADSLTYSTRSNKKDFDEIVNQVFTNSNVFSNSPGRAHPNFCNFKPNVTKSLQIDK